MAAEKEGTELYYTGEQSFSPVPMHVASVPIKPIDKGKLQATAFEAMRYHADQQIGMLRKQAELLMQQVREIEERVEVSRDIYEAEFRFKPEVGNIYHLYENDGKKILSLIGPHEWGRSVRFEKYLASVRLLGDKTWEIITRNA
ncbi:MAG: DUF2452 domain-containing protein [Bacteroidetes bacterium]|nr:DUF2452 domain-containing protein [Bacteroidota bacterium]